MALHAPEHSRNDQMKYIVSQLHLHRHCRQQVEACPRDEWIMTANTVNMEALTDRHCG
jgi:hypothetical protein